MRSKLPERFVLRIIAVHKWLNSEETQFADGPKPFNTMNSKTARKRKTRKGFLQTCANGQMQWQNEILRSVTHFSKFKCMLMRSKLPVITHELCGI